MTQKAIVGEKVGMTQVWDDQNRAIPVTVVKVTPTRVVSVKTPDRDGYAALQVTYGTVKASRLTKPESGHFAKAGVEGGTILKEFRIKEAEAAGFQPGAKVGVDIFAVGQMVDVSGTSIGKGFAGVIKRHHMSGNRASHGASVSHRTPGSTGQNQSPGRVFPGKRMAGHLGAKARTIQSLEIVRIDAERQLLLVKGSVPGYEGGHIVVKPAAKARKRSVPAKK